MKSRGGYTFNTMCLTRRLRCFYDCLSREHKVPHDEKMSWIYQIVQIEYSVVLKIQWLVQP